MDGVCLGRGAASVCHMVESADLGASLPGLRFSFAVYQLCDLGKFSVAQFLHL